MVADATGNEMLWARHQEIKCTCRMSNTVDAASLDGVFLINRMPFHPRTNIASHRSVEMSTSPLLSFACVFDSYETSWCGGMTHGGLSCYRSHLPQ